MRLSLAATLSLGFLLMMVIGRAELILGLHSNSSLGFLEVESAGLVNLRIAPEPLNNIHWNGDDWSIRGACPQDCGDLRQNGNPYCGISASKCWIGTEAPDNSRISLRILAPSKLELKISSSGCEQRYAILIIGRSCSDQMLVKQLDLSKKSQIQLSLDLDSVGLAGELIYLRLEGHFGDIELDPQAGYPYNPSIDLDADGTPEWSYPGLLTHPLEIHLEIKKPGKIPILVSSQSLGKLRIQPQIKSQSIQDRVEEWGGSPPEMKDISSNPQTSYSDNPQITHVFQHLSKPSTQPQKQLSIEPQKSKPIDLSIAISKDAGNMGSGKSKVVEFNYSQNRSLEMELINNRSGKQISIQHDIPEPHSRDWAPLEASSNHSAPESQEFKDGASMESSPGSNHSQSELQESAEMNPSKESNQSTQLKGSEEGLDDRDLSQDRGHERMESSGAEKTSIQDQPLDLQNSSGINIIPEDSGGDGAGSEAKTPDTKIHPRDEFQDESKREKHKHNQDPIKGNLTMVAPAMLGVVVGLRRRFLGAR